MERTWLSAVNKINSNLRRLLKTQYLRHKNMANTMVTPCLL